MERHNLYLVIIVAIMWAIYQATTNEQNGTFESQQPVNNVLLQAEESCCPESGGDGGAYRPYPDILAFIMHSAAFCEGWLPPRMRTRVGSDAYRKQTAPEFAGSHFGAHPSGIAVLTLAQKKWHSCPEFDWADQTFHPSIFCHRLTRAGALDPVPVILG